MSKQDKIELQRYKGIAEEQHQTLALMKTQHEDLRKDYAWVLKMLHAAIKKSFGEMIVLSPEQLSDTSPETMRLNAREVPNEEGTEVTIVLELVPADEGEPEKPNGAADASVN